MVKLLAVQPDAHPKVQSQVQYVGRNSLVYLKYDSSVFVKDGGVIYTEFEDGIATRQINTINDDVFISSSLTDWIDGVGFLLYDGHISDLEIVPDSFISQLEFENIWQEALTMDCNKSSLTYLKCDASSPLTNSTLIIHVVNSLGVWGKGFVLSLSKQFPQVKKEYLRWSKDKENFIMGEVQFECVERKKNVFIANMLAQKGIKKNYQDNKRYIDYDALRLCLKKVARFALINRLSIQMPKIGAGLAGGNWEEVEKIINEELVYYRLKCNVCEWGA